MKAHNLPMHHSIWLGSTNLDPSASCRNDNPSIEDVEKTDGIALAYIPLQPDEDFKNPLEVFSTWKFDYKEEETKRLEKLARGEFCVLSPERCAVLTDFFSIANFLSGQEQLKTLVKGVWMRKKKQREEEEANERKV